MPAWKKILQFKTYRENQMYWLFLRGLGIVRTARATNLKIRENYGENLGISGICDRVGWRPEVL